MSAQIVVAYAPGRHAVAQKSVGPTRHDRHHRKPLGQALQQLGRPGPQAAVLRLVDNRCQYAVEVQHETGAGGVRGEFVGGWRTGHG